jgi:hypothetical protein
VGDQVGDAMALNSINHRSNQQSTTKTARFRCLNIIDFTLCSLSAMALLTAELGFTSTPSCSSLFEH